MSGRLLKLDPCSDNATKEIFSLDYYRSLTTAARFRMIGAAALAAHGGACATADLRWSPETFRSRTCGIDASWLQR